MREVRGGNRGHEHTRSYSRDPSSSSGEHIQPRTPEEQAAERVAMFRSHAEHAASHAAKLAEKTVVVEWRAEKANIEKRRHELEQALPKREKAHALSKAAQQDLEAAKAALEQVADALKVAKEPRPKPPVAGEVDIEPRILDRSAHPDDVLAWAAGLSNSQRRALSERLTDARTPKSKEKDAFAIELANYLANARALAQFRNVLADPKAHFNPSAYAKSRAAREASTGSGAPATQQSATQPSAVTSALDDAGHEPPRAGHDGTAGHSESEPATITPDEQAALQDPESILRGMIESGEPDPVALATIDGTTRRQLARRLRTYRPPGGFELGALFIRLDTATRERILEALVAEPARSSPSSHADAHDSGKLPDEIRGELEYATGRSLDHVNVHAGPQGQAMADAHGARAVAVGSDIYFGAGQLDPVGGEGRELIAHEVAHTVQTQAHPGPLAAAAKRDGGAIDAAEREADAFAARFRAEGASATWSPSVSVSAGTAMRAPGAQETVDAARVREGFNAKLDNQLSIAARKDANISAPAYLHLHMAEVRRGVHLFLASRNLASGDPQVQIRDSFFDALFAAFDGNDTAASVTRLRNWVAPADLYAIIDRNRPIFEVEKAQRTHPSAALDYQHGPKGPAHWSPAVATAIGSAIEPRLMSSLARMSPRLVAVTARKREAARQTGEAPAPVQPKELVCEHPLDWHVALAMVGRATPGVEVKEGPLNVSPEAQVTYRKVTEVEWQGGRGGAWNALRPVAPHDANVAEIAVYVFGKSTEAYRIQRVGPYFLIPEDEAGRFMPAAMFRGVARAGTNALAFGATAAVVETAEVERPVARDQETGNPRQRVVASAAALEAQWTRIHEQLQGIAIVVRPYGLDAALADAIARHQAHKAGLQTLTGKDADIRAELFARQTVLLTKIAAEVGSIASQADLQRRRTASITAALKAIGASHAQDDSTTIALQRLVHAANLSHLPETGQAAFDDARAASRDTIADTLEAMLGQAATQIEIARVTMSRSHGSSSRSTRVFGASFQQRTDVLRQRLAELRSKLLHGTADPAEIQALFAAIDALRTETSMVAQIGQLGHLFDVLDQLESSGWVLFSEALTAKIGETSDDNRIGRLETARRGAFELRSDLQTLHSQWLKIQTSANVLAEQLAAGGVANAQDQATAAVLPQLDAIRGKLAKLGGDPAVQAFLRDAYEKVDSAQTRAMVVQIASMVGIAIASGGVAAMAEGVAIGAGATAFGAQLAALGVETTMFTLLSARLSGESIVHAFASNFAGNLVTFGAIRTTNALVAGSAIGRTLAQAKAGERVSRLAVIAAKTAEISAPMLVAIGVQFAQAEAEMLLREGRTLTMDELTATGVQGIAMMIGAAVTHKVLGESMNEAKAFGADFAARKAQRARLERLAQQVMAQGDGSQALDLMLEARAYVDAEVAKWQELNKLPANELEARGLSKQVVDTMGTNAQAHMAALDAMEGGTIAAQLGLDIVVPGHVYSGDRVVVQRVLKSYRNRGYSVETEPGGGYLVSGPDTPTALRIIEHRSSDGLLTHDGGRPVESHDADTQIATDLEAITSSMPLLERIDAATGVEKGPAYAKGMADLRAFYENMQTEAQAGREVRGNQADGAYTWAWGHKVQTFSHGLVNFEVRVFLDGSEVSGAELAHLQRQVYAGVDHHYNHKKLSVRGRDGVERRLHISVSFVDDPATSHIYVRVHPGNDYARLNDWFVHGNPTTHAHEITHGAFGIKDEYYDWTGAAPDRARPDAPGVRTDQSLMGNYWVGDPIRDNYADPRTSVKQRHLDEIGQHVPAHPGRATGEPPRAPVGRDASGSMVTLGSPGPSLDTQSKRIQRPTKENRQGVPSHVPVDGDELRAFVDSKYGDVIAKYKTAPHEARAEWQPLIDELRQLRPGELAGEHNSERSKDVLSRWGAIAKKIAPPDSTQAVDLRTVYNQFEKVDMPKLLSDLSHLPLEVQSTVAHMMREEIKVYIRDLMTDDNSKEVLYLRDLALYGHRRGPAFDDLFDERLAATGSAESAFAAIIGSSMQSNKHVNKELTGNESGLKASSNTQKDNR